MVYESFFENNVGREEVKLLQCKNLIMNKFSSTFYWVSLYDRSRISMHA